MRKKLPAEFYRISSGVYMCRTYDIEKIGRTWHVSRAGKKGNGPFRTLAAAADYCRKQPKGK